MNEFEFRLLTSRSLRRDRDQRQLLIPAGFGKREEKHDGGERVD
jgi:hypothetical protein